MSRSSSDPAPAGDAAGTWAMSEANRAPSTQIGGAPLHEAEPAPWPAGCDPARCPLRQADRRALAYLHALADRSGSADGDRRLEFTSREAEILDSLCHDMTCEEIAQHLQRSPVTIRNHVQHILRKAGAHSIPEVVARYLLRGWD